jgi:hypothetical protein
MKRTQHEKMKMTKKKYAVSAALLICICAAAVALLLTGSFNKQETKVSLLDFGTVTQGVHIAGVDLSGMTKQEAIDATDDVPEKLLSEISIPIDVNGEIFTLSAKDAGLDTDYEDAMINALSYGHIGTIDDRMKAVNAAENEPVDFAVTVRARKENVEAAVYRLKEKLDKEPVDAGCRFTPKGHYSNGAEYDPKISGQPVRIPESEMPGALRYQYYRTDEFVGNYIPADADISRFLYLDEEDGFGVDVASIVFSVMTAVERGDYSVIKVPLQAVKPAVSLNDVRYRTQLVSSWTSSYESHDNAGRNYNVAKLSGIINGVVIKPGEIWSINEEAGPRTYGNGWEGAPGILDGAFVTEPGGGVCQISSTVYNAAIRAGLEIVESSRHSVISNYIPLGLDATISTGTKDLKLKNPYSTPVFIVSYVNKSEKNVTVEIYAPPVIDEKHGQVILDFSSEVIERTEVPGVVVHYDSIETPDGKPIAPGKSKMYVTARRGTKAQVYIHYISPDGKELEKREFYIAVYPKIEGHEYVNGPPPES